MTTIFKLPDLGEGLPDAEIREWYVKVGDEVKIDQVLASMETAKAVVDVPSPRAGKIKKLYGQDGDVIITGQPLVEFEGNATEDRPDGGTVAGALEVGNELVAETAVVATGKTQTTQVKTTPAVRQLAQQLNVDLNHVSGTGPQGMVTAADVRAFYEGKTTADQTRPATAHGKTETIKGLRRQMAISMAAAHAEVVPVSIVDDVIIQFKKEEVTERMIRAIVYACKEEPALNAWFDGQAGQRTLHSDVHLGMAIDSEEGLMVPVIKSVQDKINDPAQLRQTINEYKELAQSRRFAADQLKDATITLSNFGRFAGRYASPVVVPPQVAIVGVGRFAEQAVVVNGQLCARFVLPISLTMDHRAVTGGEAARFLAALLKDLST